MGKGHRGLIFLRLFDGALRVPAWPARPRCMRRLKRSTSGTLANTSSATVPLSSSMAGCTMRLRSWAKLLRAR